MGERLLDEAPPKRLVIEKPIAPTPAGAKALHSRLVRTLGAMGVPYLLGYCDWAKAAVDAGPDEPVLIQWGMTKRNASDCWKYSAAAGGGSLAFYCIHVIALMIDALGTPEMHPSVGRRGRRGRTGLPGTSPPTTAGRRPGAVNSRLACSAGLFRVAGRAAPVPGFFASPFGPFPAAGAPDPRVPLLQEFYRETIFAPGKSAPAEAERLGACA